ncbi:uroporphyrinogen-III C-methyltransferase [Pandoraea sp.]|uniref:uroporphyrinogen-III C-methyltransferase n=1 Tax=Pandoraea sp. TaxID=1883445 RepID=UPI0011FFBE40|nr:uroporphyrinogen-III C-methyltransferase [Pandoraea sp.]TAL54459.1 MAG: hypothetical protein EPN80_11890 [Pandoraea sp.]TAM17507.1 MAG: hypothetical protein EPN65_11000 [Pandoraea sp.]
MPTDNQASNPTQAAPAAAPSSPSFDAPAPRRRGAAMLPWLLLVLVAAGAALGGWSLNQKIGRVEQAMSKRQQVADSDILQAKLKTEQALDTLRDVQSRLTALDTRVANDSGQQAALQQLYQDLSRNRDAWVLAETEQIVSSANQQLQLTGDVHGALLALEGADARLAGTGTSLATVRAALEKDIARLKTVPAQDIPQLAGKLDQAIAQIDSLPLQAEYVAPAGNAGPAQAPAATLSQWRQWWHQLVDQLGASLKQLIQVRRLDQPDEMLVSPSQGAWLRANLKLRLLNARLALLARDQKDLHANLRVAQTALSKYFDVKSQRTQAVQALLTQVDSGANAVELPTLAGSLSAIAQVKVKN